MEGWLSLGVQGPDWAKKTGAEVPKTEGKVPRVLDTPRVSPRIFVGHVTSQIRGGELWVLNKFDFEKLLE